MIHIIVYSTTNTAAKMYKKKKPFQNNSGGCDGWTLVIPLEAVESHLPLTANGGKSAWGFLERKKHLLISLD